MNPDRKKRVEMIAADVRKRWGTKALDARGAATLSSRVQVIPSGFPSLDRALGINGIPRSYVTEFWGTPTSGIVTIALKIIASAQSSGDVAAYLDMNESLDADYASRCDVDLNKLLLIRPQPKEKSLEMLYDLVKKRGVGIIVFDSLTTFSKPPDKLTMVLRRINRALAESGCALIFVSSSPRGMLSHEAAVRLSIQRKHWLERQGDIYGYVSQITVTKNNFSPSGRKLLVSLDFEGVVLGDAA